MTNKTRVLNVRTYLESVGILSENENIYTKNVWRKMGYKVHKDKQPIAIIPIYVCVPYKTWDCFGNGITKNKMLAVKAHFYQRSQVTEMAKSA